MLTEHNVTRGTAFDRQPKVDVVTTVVDAGAIDGGASPADLVAEAARWATAILEANQREAAGLQEKALFGGD